VILFRYLQGCNIVIVMQFRTERVLRVFFCWGSSYSSFFWQSGDPDNSVYTPHNLPNYASLLVIGLLFSVTSANKLNPQYDLWEPNYWNNACPVKPITCMTKCITTQHKQDYDRHWENMPYMVIHYRRELVNHHIAANRRSRNSSSNGP